MADDADSADGSTIDPSVIQTVAAEAAGEPPQGQQAVLATVLNRAAITGLPPAAVVAQPSQYKGYARRGAYPVGSPQYNAVAANVAPLANGQVADPTGGATHFYAPALQAARGMAPPKFAQGQGQQIGKHIFYGGNADADTPSQNDLDAAIQANGMATDPNHIGAPAAFGDPDAPLPGLQRDPRSPNVWRDVNGVPRAIGMSNSEADADAGPSTPGVANVTIGATSDPASVADFMNRHPELANAPDGWGKAATETPGPDDIDAAIAKGGFSTDPNGPMQSGDSLKSTGPSANLPPPNVWGLGGDPGKPTSAYDELMRSTGATVRGLANSFTGGLANKALAGDAALPALFRGGLPALAAQYSSNMDSLQQRDQADASEVPAAHYPSSIAGTVLQAGLLPEVAAPGWLGRAAIGAGQGAMLAGADQVTGARGGLKDAGKGMIAPMVTSAVVGAPLGGFFGAGPPVAKQAASLADYARAGVDPMLAVNGGRGAQQVAETLKGIPFVGAPLAKAAETTAGQIKTGINAVADRMGTASDPYQAGGSVQSGALAAKARFKAASDELYRPINRLERNTTPVPVDHTQKAVADLQARYPNIPQWFARNAPKVAEVGGALNGAKGHLTFAELKSMRNDIGTMISDRLNVNAVDQGRLKTLYGAMSDDMHEAAGQLGGAKAQAALSRADTYHAAMKARVDEALDPFLKDGVSREDAFRRVVGAAQSGGRADLKQLRQLSRSLPEAEFRNVGAGVIHTLGRDANDGFSVAKFATAWDKLTPQGKEVLFGRDSSQLKSLDALSKVSKQQVAAGKFYNHSNSAHTAGVMVGLEQAAEFAGHLMSGNHSEAIHQAATAALGAIGGRTAATLLASPRFARLMLRASSSSTPTELAASRDALASYAAKNPDIAHDVQRYTMEFMSRVKSNAAPGLATAASGRYRQNNEPLPNLPQLRSALGPRQTR